MIRAGANASAFFNGNGGGNMSEVPGLMEDVEAVKVMFEGTEIFLKLGGNVANWTVDKIARITVLIVHHINKIVEMLRNPMCNFVLYVGMRKLVKRKEFEQYLSSGREI